MKMRLSGIFISRRAGLLAASVFLYIPVFAQRALEEYIQEGLRRNLALRQKEISIVESENALRIAKSYFLPSLDLLGDYTSGQGGRSISLPLGDLLNPVYRSLNELTEQDRFSLVANASENFFPKNFYDVKIRTSVPLLNTDLLGNTKLQAVRTTKTAQDADAFRRQLVFDIQAGYYRYLQARASVHIYESARSVIDKNMQYQASRVRNGAAVPASLQRLRSERARMDADVTFARNEVGKARRSFNFLLDRDAEDSIIADFRVVDVLVAGAPSVDVSSREELQMAYADLQIRKTSLQISRLSRLPRINAFVDVGSQASDWRYNADSRYYLAGVQVLIPVFRGLRTNLNVRQRALEVQAAEVRVSEVARQLALAANIARSDYASAVSNFLAAREQLKAAESYFSIIGKGYREGVDSLLEFLDAQNQLTTSQLQLNVRACEVMIARARMERETASSPLPH